jgi:putative flippase GtrA
MIITSQKDRIRFAKFAVVGLIGAVIDFGVFNALTATVVFFKQNAIYAQAISFTLAVFSNFLWNRYWTYKDSRSKSIGRQLVQFILISFIGLGIRTPIFGWLETVLKNWLTNWWPKNFLTPVFVAHNLSLAIVIGVVMIWNFLANRFWTYNDVSS